jgi:hypothetical protein
MARSIGKNAHKNDTQNNENWTLLKMLTSYLGSVYTKGYIKVPPHELLGMSDLGGGSPPVKFLPPHGMFLNPTENSCPPRPTLKTKFPLHS